MSKHYSNSEKAVSTLIKGGGNWCQIDSCVEFSRLEFKITPEPGLRCNHYTSILFFFGSTILFIYLFIYFAFIQA